MIHFSISFYIDQRGYKTTWLPITYIHFQVIETDTIFTKASGLQQILAVGRDICKHRKNLDHWATKFSPNLTSFREALKDFEKSNVENYLKTVFRLRCSDSLDSMYNAFRYIIHSTDFLQSFRQVIQIFVFFPSYHVHSKAIVNESFINSLFT